MKTVKYFSFMSKETTLKTENLWKSYGNLQIGSAD